MDIRVILIAVAMGLFALWLLYRSGFLSSAASAIVSFVLMGLAMWLKVAVFDYETLDYQNFLAHWVEFFRLNGGFAALDTPVGNYNIPYLYFLALFSYSDINDLYLIKLLSVFFDILLSWGAALLLGRFTRSAPRKIALFFTVFMWPTVFLNGSLWGQCDSSYVAFLVLGIYLALDERPALSMVCAALAFGFKLQAVFILPVYAALWFIGKLRLRHFLIFPVAYVILVLPAVIAGRPFWDTITLYFNQTGSIGDGLNYNSPSVYSFFQYSLPEQYHELACKLGIIAAFAFMLGLLTISFVYRKRLRESSILALSLLFAIGIPFLLPHMHDRYFFCADILSLVLAFVSPLFAAVAVCVEFASLLGYHAYLKMRYLLLMDRGAWALLAALVFTALFFARSMSEKSPKKKIEKN